MDIPINFNDQCCFVAVKIDNKSRDDLLSSEVDSQLVSSQFLPKHFLGRRHIVPQFTGAFQFCFFYSLTWNDVFDGHGFAILPLSRLPQGGEAKNF